jgi:transposase
MLTLSIEDTIFVAREPVDGRLNFNGLFALVQNRLKADPLSGQLYVFTNRQRNRLRILYWDGTGLWLCNKRLEKGTFAWNLSSSEEPSIRFNAQELIALIQGIEIRQRRGWYRKTPQNAL